MFSILELKEFAFFCIVMVGLIIVFFNPRIGFALLFLFLIGCLIYFLFIFGLIGKIISILILAFSACFFLVKNSIN
jgi:hypothetical protein